MDYCEKCGSPASSGEEFCDVCGASVSASASESAISSLSSPSLGTDCPLRVVEIRSTHLKLTFVKAFKLLFREKSDGRAGRREFWLVALWGIAIFFAIFLGARAILAAPGVGPTLDGASRWIISLVPTIIFGCFFLVPLRAVLVRRLHDLNVSGTVAFPLLMILGFSFVFVPAICAGCIFEPRRPNLDPDGLFALTSAPMRIVLGIFAVPQVLLLYIGLIPGSPEPNRYGLPPKANFYLDDDRFEAEEASTARDESTSRNLESERQSGKRAKGKPANLGADIATALLLLALRPFLPVFNRLPFPIFFLLLVVCVVLRVAFRSADRRFKLTDEADAYSGDSLDK